MIPRPFTRIVLMVGEPVIIDKKVKFDELQILQDDVEKRLNNLTKTANTTLLSL